MVEQFLDTREHSIVSIVYGPEWRTLRVISRSVRDNELIAVEHQWDGSAFSPDAESFTSRRLYATKSERMIRLFNAFREQIARTPSEARDYPVVSTSNPVWTAHLLPDVGVGILLEFPWSLQDCYWMSMATTLMEASISDTELLSPVIPRDDYQLQIAQRLIAPGVRIERDGAISSWEGWYIHLVLSLFDLERQYAETLAP